MQAYQRRCQEQIVVDVESDDCRITQELAEAGEDILADLMHHLDWMKRKRGGSDVTAARGLIARLQCYVDAQAKPAHSSDHVLAA